MIDGTLNTKNQDEEMTFTSLYNRYYGKAYSFISLYISSETEREDILQDVFTKVWDERLFIREKDHFINYLYILVRNAVLHESRKSFNEDEYKFTVLHSAMGQSYEIENDIVTADLKSYVDNLLSGLTPRQRQIFKLSRQEHPSYKEISQKLNISEKTIERHMSDALKYIKDKIH